MKKQTKEQIALNKKICNQLEGKRKFVFQWEEQTQNYAVIEAESEAEAKMMWEQGEYSPCSHDVEEAEYIIDSLDITEEEEE